MHWTYHGFLLRTEALKWQKPSEFLDTMFSICEYSRYLSEYAKFRNEDLEYLQDIWRSYRKERLHTMTGRNGAGISSGIRKVWKKHRKTGAV